MAITWNEKLSDELKNLNKIAKPTAAQKQRIATLKGIKAVKTGKSAAVDPSNSETTGTTNSNVTTGVNDNIAASGAITNPQDLINQAPKTFDPSDPYYQDLYKTTYQTNYDLLTSGLDKKQKADLEEAKQEAANRGLVYDPNNAQSAWGKTVGAVTDRYDQLYQNAGNQAYNAANQMYSTQGALGNQGFQTFMSGVLGISANDIAAIEAGTASQDVKNRYQLGLKALKKPTGGNQNSGGAKDTSPIMGGDAQGWGL